MSLVVRREKLSVLLSLFCWIADTVYLCLTMALVSLLWKI